MNSSVKYRNKNQNDRRTRTARKESQMDPTLINFQKLFVLTQLCGLVMILLMVIWIYQHLGGLSLNQDQHPNQHFNWHPLFMTIGFIYLYGDSIMTYRGYRYIPKNTLKLIHAVIHLVALVLTLIALKVVFDTSQPKMYSLHSWLGLSAVIIFCLQYVAGFLAYLSPGMRIGYKQALMPYHIYFGIFGFVLAIASALMGLTEKAIYTLGSDYSQLSAAAVLPNLIGVFYVVFGGLVVYLITESSYKRMPLPED